MIVDNSSTNVLDDMAKKKLTEAQKRKRQIEYQRQYRARLKESPRSVITITAYDADHDAIRAYAEKLDKKRQTNKG